MEYVIGQLKAGIGEHVPRVSLSDAFIHSESRNIRRRRGLYEKVKGRLSACRDANDAPIACPQYVYAVTAVDQATQTFTIAGNHAAAIAAPLRINGSTANDGLYTLVSATDVGDTTEIVIAEEIADDTVDGNVFAGATAVLRKHVHTKESSQTEYLLLATAYHILLWTPSDYTLTVKFTCTTPEDVENWSMDSFQDRVYATNGVDYVQVWDIHTSASNDFENVGGANGIEISTGVYLTAARFVHAYEGYLILGHTLEDGEWRRRRGRWCDADDPEEWNTDNDGDQGYKDLADDEGFVNGFGRWSTYLIIAGTKRMIRAWLTTTDTVFQFDKEYIAAGCLAPDSMVNDKFGRLFFLASDLTLRELDSAQTIYRAIEPTVKSLNPLTAHNARGIYCEELDRIFWAAPTTGSATNDLLIEYDPYEGDFYFREMPISAFGLYARSESVTYETLPYDTYDEWGLAWGNYDGPATAEGMSYLLASDYEGYVYEMEQSDTDAGTDLPGVLVFGSSFDQRLHGYKRISSHIVLIFQREPAGTTIEVHVRRDTQNDWTLLGEVSLADSGNPETVWVRVPCDIRARHFTFKIAGDHYFRFISAYFPEIEPDGDR